MRLNGFRGFIFTSLVVGSAVVWGQDRWAGMPGHREYQEAVAAARGLPRYDFASRWTGPGQLEFQFEGKRMVFDLASREVRETAGGDRSARVEPWPVVEPQQQPARGRQFTEVRSPDGALRAYYEDGNVFLESSSGVKQVTTEGDLAKKVKFGSGSWVYGEELGQRHAMGFSPDSQKLWLYRFDESPVETYWLTLGHRDQQVTLYPEAYPKPGKDNPIVDLYAYDIPSGTLTKVKVRDGEFGNGLGHYVYAITFGEDSAELFYHRMDRRQKVRELVAANPLTGEIRVVDRVEHQPGYVESGPLSDVRTRSSRGANPEPFPNRILMLDDNDGFLNLYWLDTKAGARTQVTRHQGDVQGIVGFDDANNRLFYTCADGETPYRHQLYVVNLDGTGQTRLTDPAFHHTVQANEGFTAFAVKSENGESLPKLSVVSASGEVLKELGQFEAGDTQGFLPRKWFTAPSLDGEVDLYVTVDFPRNFDPAKKYPVMVSVYGGPLGAGRGPSETYGLSSAQASTGFLWVKVYGRAENGRGRDFRQAIYGRMGIVEIDDQAAGVKALAQFPWADTSRVGIYGTSYGGYASAMAILRYPELFHAASSSAMVSQWTNYDTTYTERYMGLLEDNEEGYKAGSCMTYASNLKGWLMLYFGTADDNTHPSNTLQLADALTRAGKSFELQAGVDRGHSGLGFARMMEFFVERLVVQGPRG